MGEYRKLGYYIEEVLVCDSCCGKGEHMGRWIDGDKHTKIVKCRSCHGSGKVSKTVNIMDVIYCDDCGGLLETKEQFAERLCGECKHQVLIDKHALKCGDF